MVKLFVTDLDGTLLPSGAKITPENVAAAQKMIERGITVTIATGRMYKAALPVAKALGVDVPIITYNGALIKSTAGEVLYSSYISVDLTAEVLAFCRERDWYVQLYSDDELYYAERIEAAIGYETAQEIKGHAVGAENIGNYTAKVTKLLSITNGVSETDERIAVLNEEFNGRLLAIKSNANYAEIVNPGVSKASALKALATKLGIGLDYVMAIGDSDNDLPMLKAAGQSIAMGNAVDSVKAACNYVTDTCENNGFAQAVYKYVL